MSAGTSGDAITVRLVKHRKPAVEYPGVVVRDDGDLIVIEAPWSGDAVDLGVVRFEEGDVFVEHYWRNRWCAVKRCTGADGIFKGWYCDAARPATLKDGVLTSIDLDLDLWVPPDRKQIVLLDEDEFEASGWADNDAGAARWARAAIDELEHDARVGAFPFV